MRTVICTAVGTASFPTPSVTFGSAEAPGDLISGDRTVFVYGTFGTTTMATVGLEISASDYDTPDADAVWMPVENVALSAPGFVNTNFAASAVRAVILSGGDAGTSVSVGFN